MPINSIIDQPIASSLHVAYRPIIISVNATATASTTLAPPVVYCDVYFNSVYYKTISKTQYAERTQLTDTSWFIKYIFDIQDLCQEYLRHVLGEYGGGDIIGAESVIASVYCKLRASGLNTEGFIEQEGAPPVQGTATKVPVSGTGIQTNTFHAVNATLQHLHNQDLQTHLDAYKTGTWAADAWPLTHRSIGDYKACENQSDYFPIIYSGNKSIKCFKIYYRYTGESAYREDQFCMPTPCAIVNVTANEATDNGNDTQNIQFTWDALPGNITAVNIIYRPSGGGEDDWVTSEKPATSPQFITLPLGKFDFKFQAKGDCIPTSSAVIDNVGVNPSCTSVSFDPDTEMPDAVVGMPYNFLVPLTGTPPFAYIPAVLKPNWLNIAVVGSNIVFSGTPSLTNVTSGHGIYFGLQNCATTGLAIFSKSIKVIEQVSAANKINITIKPGSGWAPQNPYTDCYRWRGTITVLKASDNTTVDTQTWLTHDPTNILQIETIAATGLEDGNYILDWSLFLRTECLEQDAQVRYFETFMFSVQKNAADTKVVNVTGGITKNITIEVEKS